MIYRLASVEDLPALAAQRWEFRREANEPARESQTAFAVRFAAFGRAGLTGQWAYWIAETESGELVAHIAVCIIRGVPRPARASDQWGYLTDCFTRASDRNRGIGATLLAHVRDWAVTQDLELLLAWPDEEASSWYARAGFVDAAEVRVLALRGFDEEPRVGTGRG